MQNQDKNEDDTFDFQKELFELLSTEDTVNDNVCLISNLPLEDTCVKLVCGHKFNYDSIFNEIKYQKNPNHLETQKLYTNELKCPYCRTIQKGLLPSRDNFQNLHGVNWPKKYQYMANKCIYTYISGKRKGSSCDKKCFNKYCTAHEKIMIKRETKQLEKEQEKLLKQLTNVKENVNKKCIPTCKYVYKRGKKKGMQCSCKKPFPSTPMDLKNFPWYCKTHYRQLLFKKQHSLNTLVNINNIGENVVITV